MEKRIDEKEAITDGGEVIRVYVLHPEADKMLAEEIAHGYFIMYPSISVWANRFATFFNQAYTALYPCTFGVVDVHDEWVMEACAIARILDKTKEVTPETIETAFNEVFAYYFDEAEIAYKDRTAFFAYIADKWNADYAHK